VYDDGGMNLTSYILSEEHYYRHEMGHHKDMSEKCKRYSEKCTQEFDLDKYR
jgi:hypothetical protein